MEEQKYTVIALMGEAGSGKDTLARALVKETGWNNIVSCTTRPPRERELNGIDYWFLDNDTFTQKVLNGEILEATIFNNWGYGTAINALSADCPNIGVFNPAGIRALSVDRRIDLHTYYLEVSEKDRLIRQLQREMNPDIDEIFRRLKADREDFDDLEFKYTTLINSSTVDLNKNVNFLKARFS